MRRTEYQRNQLAMLTVLLWAVGKAMAQEQENAPERRIVVSIPDRKLALVEDGKVVKVYQTAVGAPKSPSPSGTFTVATRLQHPTWYHAGKVVPPGKANPLGTRWLGLSTKGYGIHGTNAPRSIGRNVSHGCIRMLNHDVEELFDMVSVGVVVELHSERDEVVAQIFPAPAEPVVVAAAGGGLQ
jgi:lipoprotein-anchoring transpeptidase ErfK/SrfK